MSQKPAGSSLTVLGGALDGTVFRLAEAGELLVGSDARCGLRLMLPGVAALHARLRLGPGQATAEAPSGTSGLYVNDELVAGNRTLRHGDILWLGPPGGEQSVMLQCRLVAPPAASASAPAPPVEPEFEVAEPGASPFFVEATTAAAPPPAAPAAEDAFLVLEPAAPAPAPAADDFVVLEPTAPVAPPAPAGPRPGRRSRTRPRTSATPLDRPAPSSRSPNPRARRSMSPRPPAPRFRRPPGRLRRRPRPLHARVPRRRRRPSPPRRRARAGRSAPAERTAFLPRPRPRPPARAGDAACCSPGWVCWPWSWLPAAPSWPGSGLAPPSSRPSSPPAHGPARPWS